MSGHSTASEAPLAYAPAPPDNPLKGFVPYLRGERSFPHSLEWDYTKLSDVMKGPAEFDWSPFEAKLNAAASRRHQFVARFYLEWPGRTTGVPAHLLEGGLLMRAWTNTNTQPWPHALDHTPDYEDPNLRGALTNFIRAFGARYDGDPRLGFVELGLLGTWGEWHNHPHAEWFASKTVQREILDAYEAAFPRTRLLARYPAGETDPQYESNSARNVGYHDDSFGWATAHTGKRGQEWYFETRLRRAGAVGKWRTHPIGGEVRPEVWTCLFDEPSCAPPGQSFAECLAATHASWLCNEGVFKGTLAGAVRERALEAARRLGYELHVTQARIELASGQLAVAVTVTNTGVAPFYYDWPLELGLLDLNGQLAATWPTDWKLTGIVPGESAVLWKHTSTLAQPPSTPCQVLLRVRNPLPHGLPLRFANQSQDQHLPGWLTLGVLGDSPGPSRASAPAGGGGTSLTNPGRRYTVPEKPYVVLRAGGVEAVVVDNRAVDDAVLPGHAAGYHGIAALRHSRQARSLFVPAYSGLNFEHIHDGTIQPRDVLFEPRRAPMELRVLGERVAELYQAPTPHWGLESCMRYELFPDGVIELTFECIPRRDRYANGYIGLFWASYIDHPESLDIHFRGRAEDDSAEPASWQRGVTPAHGALATHRPIGDERRFEHDPAFPLELPFGFSRLRYAAPWYFGVCRGLAWLQLFREPDRVWLTQSPSGGGSGCPAWDFQWFIERPRAGQVYQFKMRAAYLELAAPEDLDRTRSQVAEFVGSAWSTPATSSHGQAPPPPHVTE